MRYRKIDIQDRERLKAFLEDVQYDFEPPLFERIEARSNVSTINAYVDKVLEKANVMVYEKNDEFIGIIIVYANDSKNNQAYIPFLAVKNSFSGKGIATRLLENAIQIAKDNHMEKIGVKTWNDNKPAIHLYRKFGFNSEIRNEDVIFTKNIQSQK